ncbi:MAG: hypothetical protein L6406_15900 [Desulfobacterales bacterium]|nr:hypothetical protein [Desulfobacterales bacterium]
MNSQEILEKLDRIEGLPNLPAIAMEVNEMLNPKILDYNSIKKSPLIPLCKRGKL